MSVNTLTTILARLVGVVAIGTLIPHWRGWFDSLYSTTNAYILTLRGINTGVTFADVTDQLFRCVITYDNWPFTLQFIVGVYLIWSGRLLARLLARGLPAGGLCPKCGYDCSGLPPGSKCPECGTKAALDTPPKPAT